MQLQLDETDLTAPALTQPAGGYDTQAPVRVCVCVSKKDMLLQRVCILFVCVHAHALAKSIAQSHPTPPTPHAPLLNTFTMQDTSYRSLATVLAGQSTVGTTLKQTYTNAHTHTRIDKRERRQGIRDYCPHMGK